MKTLSIENCKPKETHNGKTFLLKWLEKYVALTSKYYFCGNLVHGGNGRKWESSLFYK